MKWDVDEEIYPYLDSKRSRCSRSWKMPCCTESMKRVAVAETIRLSGRIQEDQIILEVQDDGVGMDPALLSERKPVRTQWKTLRSVQCEDTALALYEKMQNCPAVAHRVWVQKLPFDFRKNSDVEDTDE